MGRSKKTQAMKRKSTIYPDDQYVTALLEKVCDSRNREDFCDVTFVVEGKKFSAHKLIMVASSDYFSAMFSGGFKEDHEQEIKLSSVTAVAFDCIMLYVYTGKVEIDGQCLKDVYKAADLLQYGTVIEKCKLFMTDNISKDTCLEYYQFAKKHTLIDIRNKTRTFIFENFVVISKMVKFADLPIDDFISILDSDDVQCSERTIIKTLCKWLKKHGDITEEDRTKLVNLVRYVLLTEADIRILEENEIILGKENVKRVHSILLKFFMSTYSKPLEAGKFSRPRGPTCLVYVSGDGYGKVEDVLGIIPLKGSEPKHDSIFYDELVVPCTKACVVTKGNFMFILGGKFATHSTEFPMSKVHRYNPVSQSWITLASMMNPRCDHAASIMGNAILVVGGCGTHGQTLSSVEIYDIKTNTWKTRRNFAKTISNSAVCEVNGKVYMSGGWNGNDTLYDTLHMYDKTRDVWLLKGMLEEGIYSHMMCTDGSKLYIVGGRTCARFTNCTSILVFDINSGQFTLNKPNISLDVSYTSVVSHNGYLYIVGEHEKTTFYMVNVVSDNIILKYDPNINEWSVCSTKLPKPVTNTSAASLVFPHSNIY